MSAGRAAAGRRFAFYLSVQLTSVLLPGLVTVTCLTALLLHARHPRHLGRSAESVLRTLHGPAMILVDVSWLAAAFVIGYVGRELAFRVLGIAERFSRRRRTALGTLRTELEAIYGAPALGRCLSAHPLLDHLLNAAGRTGALPHTMRQPGGALRVGNAYEAFNYAKSWLRTHCPELAPDAVEAEINVLLSTLLPIVLGTWTLNALAPLGVTVATATTLAAGAVTALTFTQVLRLRRIECWEALRNLLEDHEMRLAADRLPANTRAPVEPPEPPAAPSSPAAEPPAAPSGPAASPAAGPSSPAAHSGAAGDVVQPSEAA
ncbi:hypothetical protein [Streptomyces sp. NPDC046985]|uniref:hypothetical protein n=1 Tax=Streptomyces sp. NPDC046985 TaxID=3155377 RepID=UPI00340D3B1E